MLIVLPVSLQIASSDLSVVLVASPSLSLSISTFVTMMSEQGSALTEWLAIELVDVPFKSCSVCECVSE